MMPATIDAPAAADDIPDVEFRDRARAGSRSQPPTDLLVMGMGMGTLPSGRSEATIEIKATADLPDASVDFPFSRVDFYAEVTVGDDISELRFIESVAGNSATVKTTGFPMPEGRTWTYATEVDAVAFLAAVDEDATEGMIVAFGVSTAKKWLRSCGCRKRRAHRRLSGRVL